MHALCAVPTRRPTVLVDALGLAFATAHTGTAGSERRAADDRRHGDKWKNDVSQMNKKGNEVVPND